MLKNQHLLAIIVGLSGLGTLLGLMLIVSERRSGQQIEVLTGQLADAQRQREEAESAITMKLAQLRNDQTEAARLHDETAASIQRKLTNLEKVLAPVHQDIKALEQKQTALSDDFANVEKWIDALNKRLSALEPTLKKPVKEPK